MTDDTDIRKDWLPGPASQQYILTSGAYEGRVWYLPLSQEWIAVISQANAILNYKFFKNLVEAQIWCERRLAKLAAKP